MVQLKLVNQILQQVAGHLACWVGAGRTCHLTRSLNFWGNILTAKVIEGMYRLLEAALNSLVQDLQIRKLEITYRLGGQLSIVRCLKRNDLLKHLVVNWQSQPKSLGKLRTVLQHQE